MLSGSLAACGARLEDPATSPAHAPAPPRAASPELVPRRTRVCLLRVLTEDGELQALDLALARVRTIARGLDDVVGIVDDGGGVLALSHAHGAAEGSLERIDDDGTRRPHGRVRVVDPRGLARHPDDGSLWTWSAGAVRIDPQTFVATRTESDPRALAWSRGDPRALAWSRGDPRALAWSRGDLFVGDAPFLVPDDGRSVVARGRTLEVWNDAGSARLTAWPLPSGASASVATLRALAWPEGCGAPSAGGSASLIDRIEAPSRVCAGEPFDVRVHTRDAEGTDGPVDVSIFGTTRTARGEATITTSFVGPEGPRRILAIAAVSRFVDAAEADVEVEHCPDRDWPALRVRPLRDRPRGVALTLSAAPPGARYRWSFGDGTTATTERPAVDHVYPLVARYRDVESRAFDVEVEIVERDRIRTVRKTISVVDPYAFARRRGWLLPEARVEVLTGAAASVRISNPEDEPLVFDRREVGLRPCDPAVEPEPPSLEAARATIPPGESVLSLDVPRVAGACGATVRLVGRGARSGRRAVLATHLRTGEIETTPVVAPELLATLRAVTQGGLVADRDLVTGDDLERLARERRIASLAAVSLHGTRSPTVMHVRSGEPRSVRVGDPCTPGEPPDRPGLTCQATEDWAEAPAEISNATKGDAILEPGCGMFGRLLDSVGKRWTHMGIMTRSFTELTHSTMSEDRLRHDLDLYGALGPREETLRYGFPGTITQRIDAAFYTGDDYQDRVTGKRYNVKAFDSWESRCEWGSPVVPMIARPPPGTPRTVYERLSRAADRARSEIDGHYRVYAFTDASIVDKPAYDRPADGSPFATTTRATVCSSFVWSAMRGAGFVLDPDRTPGMRPSGLLVDDATPDGLFLYTAAMRRVAAQALDTHLRNELAYPVIEAGIANRIINCFASDDCDRYAVFSSKWKSTNEGRAVAPDDVLDWEIYQGYVEPTFVRPTTYRRVHRWAASEGTGTIVGRVVDASGPVARANVRLRGGSGLTPVEVTGDDGRFRIEAVPSGRYEIDASRHVGERYESGRALVAVVAAAETEVTITIVPPKGPRTLHFRGSATVVDEENVGEDEIGIFTIEGTCTVDPGISTRRATEVQLLSPGEATCVGNEVSVKLDVICDLGPNDADVDVKFDAYIYEGDTFLGLGCGCDPKNRQKNHVKGTVRVPAGSTVPVRFEHLRCEGDDAAAPACFRIGHEYGEDWAHFRLEVSNPP
jgi:hypothetical protein